MRRLEDAGAAAVVMYSLFEEEITHESFELDHYLDAGAHSYAESMSYFPDLETYSIGPERYLEHVSQLKTAVCYPGHRQSERRLIRRLGRVRATHRGGGRGRAGAEHLLLASAALT